VADRKFACLAAHILIHCCLWFEETITALGANLLDSSLRLSITALGSHAKGCAVICMPDTNPRHCTWIDDKMFVIGTTRLWWLAEVAGCLWAQPCIELRLQDGVVGRLVAKSLVTQSAGCRLAASTEASPAAAVAWDSAPCNVSTRAQRRLCCILCIALHLNLSLICEKQTLLQADPRALDNVCLHKDIVAVSLVAFQAQRRMWPL